MKIGERLRQTRQLRKLTIDDIAGLSGLSRPYISQVETGKASPSIPSLEKLTNALEVPMASLFTEEVDPFTTKFIPKSERQVLMFGSPDSPTTERKSIHFLSESGRDLEFCMPELSPGYIAGDAEHRHEGEEVFYVVKGHIKIIHGAEEFDLHVGDSIHVNATIIHRIENIGKENAEILVSRTPAGFSDIRIGRTEGEA